MPDPVKILLSQAASDALLAVGECFVIGGKSSHPDEPGRIALHFVPVDKKLADALCGVLLGTHKVVKKKA
jgi:hypothetical protein